MRNTKTLRGYKMLNNKKLQANLISLFANPVMIAKETFDMDEETKKYIENLPKQPNRGGGGNLYTQDTYILEDSKLKKLKDYVSNYINFYFYELMSVNKTRCQIYITQSWFNYNKKETKHHPHSHPNSIISGVFYLDDNQAPITFHRENRTINLDLMLNDFNEFNSSNYSISTKKNTLIMFPSKLTHGVQSNESEKERISLSFNTYVKGDMGSISDLNYLKI